MEDRVRFALEKPFNVAHRDIDQGRGLANFLLAWLNAEVHGGFDLTDLANLDREVCEDIVTVFSWLACESLLSYPDAYKPEIIRSSAAGGPTCRSTDDEASKKRRPFRRRAVELDTIASVLPIDRRDELAELLTDRDIETLRHLVDEGMGANTLRALTSDLAYLEAWPPPGIRSPGRRPRRRS